MSETYDRMEQTRSPEAVTRALTRTKGLKLETRVQRGIENQPVSTVVWIDHRQIRANDYNPNFVPPPELRLLKISILSVGWTQPVVVHHLPEAEQTDGYEYEVNDGFHRWAIINDPDIKRLTDGMIPCVVLPPMVKRDRIMSTIRHNRARGNHQVLKMSDIVHELIAEGLTPDDVSVLMGMEHEEVQRFVDRGSMVKRGAKEEFHKGWVPK